MALYVGLVTDTGKFMYETPTPARTGWRRRWWTPASTSTRPIGGSTSVPIEKLRLVARALQKIEVHDDGVLAVTYISKQGYEAAGAGA